MNRGLTFAFGLLLAAPGRAQQAPPVEAGAETVEFSGMQHGGVVATDPVPTPGVFDGEEARASARFRAVQRNFAILAVAMPYDGFGLGVRAGGPRVGADLSASFRPVLATHSTNPEKFPKFLLLSGYQLNASLYFGVYKPNAHTDMGFSLGYKYHTLLLHGVGAAFYLQRELGPHFAFQLLLGPAVFPKAEREIRKEAGFQGGSVSSGIASIQGGLGLSLAFFP